MKLKTIKKWALKSSTYPGFQRIFFSYRYRGSRRSRVNEARALSNRKHGLFQIRYFENGTLEPGYIQPKLSKIWKQGEMVQKFPGKVSRNSGICWISEMRTFDRKFLKFREQSWMERKIAGKRFRKFGYTSWGWPFFGNFWKCCSIRYWKLPKIQTGRFSSIVYHHFIGIPRPP